MDDLIAEFLTETSKNLTDLDADLVKLEQNPNDKDLLSQIFRIIHTIKGTCGFLGLPRLEGVAHKGEDVLGLFRDGVLEVTPEYVTIIFESLDRIKYILSELEETGSEPEGDDSELIAKLAAIYDSTKNNDSQIEGMISIDDLVAIGADLSEIDKALEHNAALEAAQAEGSAENNADTEELDTSDKNGDEELLPENVTELKQAAPPVKTPVKAPVSEQDAGPKKKSLGTQSLRVNVDVLENLMTMVSELVLTRNQLLQILRQQHETDFSVPLQRLNHVVSDLQEGVMKTRMQPIGNAWAKLPRIIRDLSMELNKKIDLKMIGEDTELDRQILELIKDPLTHMVRNSGDHGIETPEERLAAGKKETGTIKLEAFHEGGHIIIQITDDGKGLAVDKIRDKVLSSGLATEEELSDMSDQQIQKFIFNAGLSTAEKVTSVSGRGVGMDVVKTNIEKIGGSIDLISTEGKGSTFTIKIPLTLAIVSAMIVESSGEKFAIPQLAVRELVMTSIDGENRIETIKGTPVFRLRDKLLPLVSLEEVLKIGDSMPPIAPKAVPQINDNDAPDETEKSAKEKEKEAAKTENPNAKYLSKYIVVTQVGAYDFGIIVDRVFDTEEIVVKPVARILKDIEMFSGNTILGDGKVIMILDPNGIAKSTGNMDTATSSEQDTDEIYSDVASNKAALLLFRAGNKSPKAVPLEVVSRLEEIKLQDIESANNRMVVQYRGKLMPLVPFSASQAIPEEGSVPVLVFADKDQSMGIIVDEIIDITEQRIDVQVAAQEDGIIGSAIIDGKATDVVDVGHYLNSVNTDWFKDHDDSPFKSGGEADEAGKRILLVEDSPFFRNMLTPLLQVAGYEVTTANNAIDALKLCEQGRIFDVIVSDIEMPEMDGFEFAQKIKADSNWQNIPMLALSSHATPQDMDRGREVGFTNYVPKFDRDNLLNALSETLSKNVG